MDPDLPYYLLNTDPIWIRIHTTLLTIRFVLSIRRSEDIEEFTEEQSLMGRLVHLFRADSADQQYQVPTSRHVEMGTCHFLRVTAS